MTEQTGPRGNSVAKRLWAFVDDSTREQVENESAEHRCVEQRDQVMAILAMSISQLLLHLVMECTTPREIWLMLKDRIERKSLMSKMLLMCESLTYRLMQGESISDHLKQFKEICDKMVAINQSITEEQK